VSESIPCPVCGTSLALRVARSRKAKRPKIFLMLVCGQDGRHFRGFIQDRDYVGRVVGHLEETTARRDGERGRR